MVAHWVPCLVVWKAASMVDAKVGRLVDWLALPAGEEKAAEWAADSVYF